MDPKGRSYFQYATESLDGPTGAGKTSLALTHFYTAEIPHAAVQLTENMDWIEFCRQIVDHVTNGESMLAGDIEGRIAPIQGREPASIGIHIESKRADEYYTFGWYDRKENTIMIGYLLFELNDPHEALSTVIHEGRHAYQWKCVNDNGVHSRHAEAERWKAEFEDYIKPEESYELYHNQAIECDARDYTRRIIEGCQ